MVAGVGWIWISLLSRKLFFGRDGRRGGGAKPDWDSRADFYPANPPDDNHRILSDFGHPVSIFIDDMASTLAIGLGVGVAAFLVCDVVSGRFG